MANEPAGTAYIDFDGDFARVEEQARAAGRRSARLFLDSYSGRALGQQLAGDVDAGFDPAGLGEGLGSGMGAGMNAGVDAGFDPDGAGGVGGKVKELGGSMKLAAAGAGLAAGAALGAAMLAGYAQAVENESGRNLLQAQLGLSDAQAASYGAAAGRVWAANFGDSAADAREAVGSVASSLEGAMGRGADALEKTSERALTFAQVFDADVPEAASVAGTAIRVGLAGDAEEAFDLMTSASQRMPAGIRGELLPAVEEYGVYLAGLGLTGEEAFGLLASASQGGAIQLDKAGDALKELQIRSTDMSETSVSAYEAMGLNATQMASDILAGGDTANAAFDSIVSGLLRMDDPVAQSTAALALFGTPLEDIGVDQIPTFLRGLQVGEDALGDFEGSTDAAADALGRGLGASVEGLRRRALDGLVRFLEGKVLPRLTDLVEGGGEVASELWDRVQPAAEDVGDALGHMADAGQEALEFVRPLGEGLLLIGGSAVLGAIIGVADGLEMASGWLARNEALLHLVTVGVVTLAALQAWPIIVSAIETMYLRWLYFQGAVTGTTILSSLGMIAGGMATVATSGLTMGQTWATGAAQARAGMSSLASAINPVALAAAAAVATAIALANGFKTAGREADEWADSLDDNLDITSISSYEDAFAEVQRREAEASRQVVGNGSFWSGMSRGARGVIELLTPMENTVLDAGKAVEETDRQFAAWGRRTYEMREGLAAINEETGLYGDELREMASALDLTEAQVRSGRALFLIKREMRGAAEEAGFRGPQIREAMTLSPAQLEEIQAQWEELSGAVSQSWGSALDAVSGLGSLEEITGDSISDWYAMQETYATEFASNITRAFELNYDPQLISRLLQAGPAEAGPIVEAMVSDYSDTLAWQVNAGEFALQQLSARAVEIARLTHTATTAESSAMAADLGDAMAITEAIGRQGANATAVSIARELGIGVRDVARIAGDYGIVLAGAVNPILESIGADPLVQAVIGARYAEQAAAQYRNAGGPIFGPDVDRDVVPAMLTPGEFVQRRSAVERWGLAAMDALNRGRAPDGWVIPGFNAGGQVTGDVDGMHPVLLSRLQAWSAAVGQPYHVGSGYRSIAEQQRLYNLYLQGRGNLAAVPGSSMHNYGLASDGNHWGGRSPGAFGLRYSVPGEPWHVEPVEARQMRGTSSHGMFFDPPPAPPSIGDWPLARGGEGAMGKAYDAAVEWMSSLAVSSSTPELGSAFPDNRALGRAMAAARGWVGAEWSALERLWDGESGWDHLARNPSSGAYGIPQALPAAKMASHGADWRTNAATQIAWGLDYIDDRPDYGSPSAALRLWMARSPHWYNAGGPVVEPATDIFVHRRTFDAGGELLEGWNLVNNQTGAREQLAPVDGRRGSALEVHGDLVVRERADIDVIVQQINARALRTRA